jgi:EF-hand domain pair/EF hand
MIRFLLPGAAALAVSTASLVSAQPSPAGGWNARGADPRTMTRADVAQRVRAMFARVDRNHDGALTPDELTMARGPMGPMNGIPQGGGVDPGQPAQRGAMAFDRLDLDHNGVITRDEFASAQPGMNGRAMGRMDARGMAGNRMEPGRMGRGGMARGGMGAAMFASADSNHDGRVTLSEATDAALRRFDMADRNRDGRISPDERQMMRSQQQNHG